MPSFAHFGNQLYSGERSLPFIERRRVWYAVAVVAVLLSLAGLGIRGLNPSIEFRGGSEFRITQVKDPSESVGQQTVADTVPGTESRTSKVNADSVRVQTDRLTKEETNKLKTALAEAYGVDEATNVATQFVGPSWGRDVSKKAIQGLLVFLVLVALVMALYFRTWKMAAAGMIALIHDLILTVGVYALVGFEVSPASVIGFLTILGYSLYDTVVVFDKVRENTEHIATSTRRTYAEAANLAVNQTLVRSINTSVVALLPVASILFIGAFLLGAGTLKDISLALFVGIAAGTYSSIFIATPLLVDLRKNEPELLQQAQRVTRRRTEEAQKAARGESAGELIQAGVGTPAGLPAEDAPAIGQRQQPKRGGRNRPGGRRR